MMMTSKFVQLTASGLAIADNATTRSVSPASASLVSADGAIFDFFSFFELLLDDDLSFFDFLDSLFTTTSVMMAEDEGCCLIQWLCYCCVCQSV
jgi:hypothetical protein